MQRFLLDTHVFLWWLADAPELGPHCRELLADQRNEVFVSAATTWEISIKKALGTLDAPEDMDSIVEDEGFAKLPISLYHGQLAGSLPALHRDPFDRMLVAQAQAEGLILMTSDTNIGLYNVRRRNPGE
ncbi:type II toxin-antitoxin system VapC family toxin [Geoalkalibacter halelectricus]|uniref:Type II toxin-antitoxin system VapC family toxin n=1 Tax=Geoalkalibacter halelectricus TaxID=2847045 RepID=A0ABY5ZHY5_9BACT|nr:type II toxin-antitoxin system VapC family toxin [Geoalkalibacter halelectricus]MDO3378010.1 type II toxin-antitoxin system VapC family toxin [Geoalkalibacter halelectricus]UWZ78311.1 type II toxin-antitoxin system VapC family toxin [Geoalkalibacter halelectricus]